ncbi:hypothetical protein CEXT_772681 [Caerostris extrusa]|uniref:Uncharacterized protein n=1 Tax=Caerostris extrusa TaxID=172846 RepID=A0AAV4PDX3_CAEEX|nr:hypothetical protein CEXT_772681 [Caerostris extrusa]
MRVTGRKRSHYGHAKARASLIHGDLKYGEATRRTIDPLKHQEKFCQHSGILPNLVKNGNSFEMTPNNSPFSPKNASNWAKTESRKSYGHAKARASLIQEDLKSETQRGAQ